jgi:hypothetical protein
MTCGHLFGSSAKDERVTALEPYHSLPTQRAPDEQRVNFVLRQGVRVGRFARVDHFNVLVQLSQQTPRRKAVDNHDISARQQNSATCCDKARISRPTTDQRNMAFTAALMSKG